ncbi:hypothetical protein HF324_29330 [Chitinophaga oryzae]|uniref:Uncharacterized protein n=1 Tax=Chitinophaga oryzae TaxID=2725414 RepID=A0ABX6LP79_9BACT|nr:hypothetical protein [Chitinophaga oryzae]QJB41726.1 hypothetical protein HF324_29330 [Chitinophaga oryzae]
MSRNYFVSRRDSLENELQMVIPQNNKGIFEQLFEIYFNGLNLYSKMSDLPIIDIVNEETGKIYKKIAPHATTFQIERLSEIIANHKKQLCSKKRQLLEQVIIEDTLLGKDYSLSEKRELIKPYLYYFIRPYYYTGYDNIFDDLFRKWLFKIKKIATAAQILRELTNKLTELKELPANQITTDPPVKIKWKGSPALLGCIIEELISKGYMERPTSSYLKDAAVYLQIFDIDTTPATLAKELSDRTNSLCAENKLKFSLPKKEHLK